LIRQLQLQTNVRILTIDSDEILENHHSISNMTKSKQLIIQTIIDNCHQI